MNRPPEIPAPPTPQGKLLERVVRRGGRIRMRRLIARGVSVAVMTGVIAGSAVAGVLHRDRTGIESAIRAPIVTPPSVVAFPSVPSPKPPSGILSPPPRQTSRVLIGSGVPGNGDSSRPAISQNGRFVAFVSDATNLAPGAVGGVPNVYVRDVETGRTSLVSLAPDGRPFAGGGGAPSVSEDGALVAFEGIVEPGGEARVYVRDRVGARTILISADHAGRPVAARAPALSADGATVAFVSDDPALILGDVNAAADVFVSPSSGGGVELVSATPDFRPGNAASGVDGHIAISGDGRWIAFASAASDLTPGDDGRGGIDVFLRDVREDITTLVSAPAGKEIDRRNSRPSISKDGSIVAYVRFVRGPTTRPHAIVLAWSRVSGRESLVSAASDESAIDAREFVAPAASSDGRFIAFVAANGRVLVRDRTAGTTATASLTEGGARARSECGRTGVAISSGGGYISFDCGADFLLGDTNGRADVFVRDVRRSTTVPASVGSAS